MRSARFLQAFSLATTLISVPVSAATQTPPDRQPAPVQPSEQTTSALKLAGLVTFVANSCPDLKPDYARFEAAIGALGVTTSDLDRSEMKARYLAYTSRYGVDPKASCLRAKTLFGPGGTALPDIFEPR